MKVEKWVEIENQMCSLMGWRRGVDAMVDAKREVSPGTTIYELTRREDTILLHKLRKRYQNYWESTSKEFYGYEKSSF